MRACVLVVTVGGLALWSGCNDKSTETVTVQSVPSPDLLPPDPSTVDAAAPPSATPDLGVPGEVDAAVAVDLAAPADASIPTTLVDASIPTTLVDASTPADPPRDLAHAAPDLAPFNPWPATDIVTYGAANNLQGPIIDANVDDAQNIWAVSPDALYLLRPGQASFLRYTADDGLHIVPFVDPAGNPAVSNITAVAGARGGEAYVGYYGYESDDRFADTLAQRQLGQADRVVVGSDGKLQVVVRYEFRCDAEHSTCWEDRSVRRMLYAHSGAAAGHLFIGFDHGVTHLFNDQFGDHIHVETWYVSPVYLGEKMGEQYGLFVLPDGKLWTAGAYGVGDQNWNPDPPSWVQGSFQYALTLFTDSHDLNVVDGYREDNRGVAVTPDGTVWFATLRQGLVSWNPASGTYSTVKRWSAPGLDGQWFLDLAADPDGTLWLVTFDGQLLRFDPATAAVRTVSDVSNVNRVWVDATVTPRAVYVSMAGGLAVIHAR
jgi:hypothetical protein